MNTYFYLGEQTVVDLRGRDRLSLLNNLCTQNLKSLQPGGGAEAFLTDVKGRTLAHVCVAVLDDAIRLVTVPGQATRIMQHLDRFIIREDVSLVDQSGSWTWVALEQLAPLQSLFTEDVAQRLSQPYANTIAEIKHCEQNIPFSLYRWPWLGASTTIVGVPNLKDSPSMNAMECQDFFAGSECYLGGPNDFQAKRISSGWPLWGTDFDEHNLPQEIGRDRETISFTKGCYLGQETVARLDALGQVQKKLTRLAIASQDLPIAGAKVLSGDAEVGWVTSAALCGEHAVAFVFLKRAYLKGDKPLSIGGFSATIL